MGFIVAGDSNVNIDSRIRSSLNLILERFWIQELSLVVVVLHISFVVA